VETTVLRAVGAPIEIGRSPSRVVRYERKRVMQRSAFVKKNIILQLNIQLWSIVSLSSIGFIRSLHFAQHSTEAGWFQYSTENVLPVSESKSLSRGIDWTSSRDWLLCGSKSKIHIPFPKVADRFSSAITLAGDFISTVPWTLLFRIFSHRALNYSFQAELEAGTW